MVRFTKGDDYFEKESVYMTCGIHEYENGEREWGNRILVFGSKELRDAIVNVLNENGPVEGFKDRLPVGEPKDGEWRD